jgi:hypothetical protein
MGFRVIPILFKLWVYEYKEEIREVLFTVPACAVMCSFHVLQENRGTGAMEQCDRFLLSSMHTTLWPGLHIQYSIELYGLQGGNTLQNKAVLLHRTVF